MKRLLLIVLLALPVSATAQNRDSFLRDLDGFFQMRADKSYAKMDSSYVGRYDYRWDVRLYSRTAGLHLATTGASEADLSTGMCNSVGVGLAYRGLGLSYYRALGRKMDVNMSLDSYGRHLCLEFTLKASSGLLGTVKLPDLPRTDADFSDLVLASSKINVFYSFNPNFSYAAAMKQSRIQRRSAGSIIAGVSWTMWDFVNIKEDITFRTFSMQFYKSNNFYNRISIGAGYGYNLVLGRGHWLLHASVIPMWSVYETCVYREEFTRERSFKPFGSFTFAGTARVGAYYRWGDRWSLGFSGMINQMSSADRLTRKNGSSRFDAQEWQALLSLCYRFGSTARK